MSSERNSSSNPSDVVEKRGASGARRLAAPAREAVGEGDGLLAAQAQPPPGQQLELVLQAPGQRALGCAVAQRHHARERHEVTGVDARNGRVAVDEGGEHRECVAVAAGFDHQTRRLRARARKPPGSHVHRNTLSQRRQNRGDEFRHRARLEVTSPAQLLELPTREPGFQQRTQRVAGARHTFLERLFDARVAGDAHHEAVAVVFEHGHEAHALGVRADGLAVQPDVGAGREGTQQCRPHAPWQLAAQSRAERSLDLEVRLARREARALHATRRDRRQRAAQRLLAIRRHDCALEAQATGCAFHAIADAPGAA
jgi:hypothetical protein